MDSLSFHPQSISVGTMDYNPDDFDTMTLSARPPNPPFHFPPRSSFDASSDNSPPPLPTFSFNPGNLHAPTPSTSTLSAPRPIGHRRRPSELIGGEGPPSPRMLGTSPGSNDGENSAPPPPPPPRGPGRRGHAHRRSQAMSSMDLTAITLSGPPTLTVGSAPTSPSDNKHEFQNHIRPMSRSDVNLVPRSSPSPPPASPVAKQPSHLRSDFPTPELKPRPVSMISTDTSSSLSTVRPNHSRVSSAVPANNRVDDSSAESVKARPKTADATLLVSKPRKSADQMRDTTYARRTSLGASLGMGLGLRQSSESEGASETESIKERKSTKKDKKKKKKKRREGGKAGLEKERKRSGSEREHDQTQESTAEKWESTSSFNSRSGTEDSCSQRLDVSRTTKQKKGRTWAGIFPLKNKRTHAKRPSRRTPTPPPILTRTNSDIGSIEVNFDEDNTVIIRTPTNTTTPNQSAPSAAETNDAAFETSWKPRSFYEQGAENDTFSPVIDLDAALGPFNTPEMSAGRVAGSAFSQATKRMYSGGRRGEFIGPEMRYHRRAESAPEMPPFDRSALGLGPRLDTAMAHADVFYEEEEDAFLAENDSRPAEKQNVDAEESEDDMAPSSSETLRAVVSQRTPTMGPAAPRDDGLGIQVAEETVSVDDGPGDSVFEDDGEGDDSNSNSNSNNNNTSSLHPQLRNKKSVEIMEVDQWTTHLHARTANHSHSPDLSPRMLAVDKRPSSSPLDLNSGLSQLTLPSRHASSSVFPSPDPSTMSFEGPRSATTSSMTDHTTFNHFAHDPRHSSVEDVPSLSSSGSTRTNLKGRFSSSFNPRSSGERRESFARPPRTSQSHSAKRASLVSLSRLVGGAYGERSKLSHEEKPPADETEKSRRRSRRVSRLMFWKSKDKQND